MGRYSMGVTLLRYTGFYGDAVREVDEVKQRRTRVCIWRDDRLLELVDDPVNATACFLVFAARLVKGYLCGFISRYFEVLSIIFSLNVGLHL